MLALKAAGSAAVEETPAISGARLAIYNLPASILLYMERFRISSVKQASFIHVPLPSRRYLRTNL